MSEKQFKKILGIAVFAISFIVYLMTMAPTVSFWDCGEFIACAYTQAVPHPPGAPLYLLVAKIFTFIPEFLMSDIASRVNLISVISSAFVVLFIFLIMSRFLKWMSNGKLDEANAKINYIGAFIGALIFAFSDSFWFNAVEAEVYAPSMFFTAIIVWLIMKWGDVHDQPGNEKYLIFISYLIGLAIGVHLLNVLALPFIVYIVYFRKYDYTMKGLWISSFIGVLTTGIVYLGVVKKLLLIPKYFGFLGLFIFFILLILIAAYAIKSKQRLVSLSLMSILVILIGYSTYGYIYIRSGLDPNIDENNPETIEKFISYMEREQYGVSQGFKKDYLERKAPFWEYQVNKMYVRYFSWQFIGRDDRTEAVDPSQLYALPFLLGLFGAYRQYRKSPKFAFANFVLFFMTGLAIVLYLNQPDPQPRERDYSYVGSFFAFAIWIGIGAAELIRELRDKKILNSDMAVKLAGAALLIVPGLMLARNYESHSRAGNYVAWDYSYNMLMSCAPNSILFTNGDNDTFPLWYLQEVEGVRTDVRIANLSLLNTDWYIKQLRDLEPKLPIGLSDKIIENVRPRYWRDEDQDQHFRVDKNTAKLEHDLYNFEFPNNPLDTINTRIAFKVPPTFGPGIKVSDLMMLRLLYTTRLRMPIYYAVTVSPDNMLGSLREYMRMDGLVFKVTPVKNWLISATEMQRNIIEKFQYRNLNDPDVYYNNSTRALLQNYRSGFLHLADYYLRKGDLEGARKVLAKMSTSMPADVIPFTNARLKKLLSIFYIAAGMSDEFGMESDPNILRDVEMFGRSFTNEKRNELAANCFAWLVAEQPANFKYFQLYVKALRESGQNERINEVINERLSSGTLDSAAEAWARSVLTE